MASDLMEHPLFLGKGGNVLMWDVTCPNTLVPSYTSLATREVGAVANKAETKSRYAQLEASQYFVSIAVEFLRGFGIEAWSFLQDLYFRALISSPSDPEDVSGRIKVQQGCHPADV